MLIDSEETYKILCEAYPLLQKDYLRRVIDEVPSAEVKGDLISREEAIKKVNTALFPKLYTAKDAEKALRELPSAERVGHWIECEDYDGDIYYECSECKEDFCLIDGTPADNLYFYCPNCGSHNPTIKRMEGEEE